MTNTKFALAVYANANLKWIIKLNSICMPLRYLWVFAAYIALKKAGDKFPAEYRLVKGRTLGMVLGGWCFALTAYP